MERYVASQLTQYLCAHGLPDDFQIAYRQGHSTETVLLSIKNDSDCALGAGDGVSLVMLDLSTSTLDTVDHDILLRRLQSCGITAWGGIAVASQLPISGRMQRVDIGDAVSESVRLRVGVP